MQGTEDFDEVVVYGARGTALSILQLLQEGWQGRVRVRALVDDLNHGFVHPFLGIPVISGARRAESFAATPLLMTLSNPELKAQLSARLVAEDALFATAIFRDKGWVSRDVKVGPGTHVPPIVRVGSNVTFGACVQFLGHSAAHDIVIGDFSTIGLNASLLGHVEVGSHVTIAPGATICNGSPERPLRIGDGAIIGVGAVVTRDVPAGARMVGNPAMLVEDWKRLRQLIEGSGPAA